MKALNNIERIQITSDLLKLLLSLYESKGKSFYYDELFNRDSNSFQKKVLEDDSYAIGKIFDFNLTDARLKLLSKKDFVFKNKDEALLLNIKDILERIQKFSDDFELLENEVIDMTKLMSKNYQTISVNTYEEKLPLGKSTKKVSKREDLGKLLNLLSIEFKNKNYELTQILSNFYIDFINMDIFSEGNNIVAIIVLYALTLKHFNVFKYISFFDLFLKYKKSWSEALVQANFNYNLGYAQSDFLSRILITILIEAYEKVDDIAYEYEFERKINKSNNIENTILKLDDVFTKEDIRKKHPTVSDATIDRTLKRLKDEDKIRPLGKGRSSKWQRIVESKRKIYEQRSLFD